MKRLFIALFFMILFSSSAFAFDYAKVYRELEPATFSYIHGIDPYQYYENKNYAWAPYPLFRLNSPIYFKSIAIQPGYYLLTPREHKGNWYMLFKDNGQVKYIIPCYNRDIVKPGFYKANLPKAKLTFRQKCIIKTNNAIGRIFKSSKRVPPPNSYLQIEDLDNSFISMDVYYGKFKYSMIFRSSK